MHLRCSRGFWQKNILAGSVEKDSLVQYSGLAGKPGYEEKENKTEDRKRKGQHMFKVLYNMK